jgi:hypothetical protein
MKEEFFSYLRNGKILSSKMIEIISLNKVYIVFIMFLHLSLQKLQNFPNHEIHSKIILNKLFICVFLSCLNLDVARKSILNKNLMKGKNSWRIMNITI